MLKEANIISPGLVVKAVTKSCIKILLTVTTTTNNNNVTSYCRNQR